MDASVRTAIQRLLDRTNTLALLRTKFGAHLPALAANANPDNGAVTELLVGEELPRPEGAPLVDDWDCLRVSWGRVVWWCVRCLPLAHVASASQVQAQCICPASAPPTLPPPRPPAPYPGHGDCLGGLVRAA